MITPRHNTNRDVDSQRRVFWAKHEPLNLPFFAMLLADRKAKSTVPSKTAFVQSSRLTHVKLAIIADLHFVTSPVQISTREKF